METVSVTETCCDQNSEEKKQDGCPNETLTKNLVQPVEVEKAKIEFFPYIKKNIVLLTSRFSASEADARALVSKSLIYFTRSDDEGI